MPMHTITPGPWRVEIDGDNVRICSKAFIVADNVTAHEDAALIATCPQLLRAAKCALKILAEPHSVTIEFVQETVQFLKQVINHKE